MITEDYVSFAIAKLLKEKGFDGECDYLYADGKILRAGWMCNWNRGETLFADYKNECSAPTLQMAMKWLRKEHNLAISTSVTIGGWRSYVSQIKLDSEGFVVDIIDGIDGGNIPNCDTYEEASEAAIKYCLEKLI